MKHSYILLAVLTVIIGGFFLAHSSHTSTTMVQAENNTSPPSTQPEIASKSNEIESAQTTKSAPDLLPDKSSFHIGIMTGSMAQGTDELFGAQKIIQLYGNVENGGRIRHVTYPDNFMAEMETTLTRIINLADDPLMKVIVINQGIPGTTEALQIVKNKRPDIITIVGEAHEDPAIIAPVADLVVSSDFISRGYLIPHSAKTLGAKTLVHISFPRHMIDESISRRRAIMEEACKDLGINFVYENAPDPTSNFGVEGAQQFILNNVPLWLKKYGPDTAFFCTNNAHTEPLLKQIAAFGGYFVEADIPSPLLGYPGAFKVDLDNDISNWPTILSKVEDAVINAGGSGRFGTWAYSLGYCHTAALAEFGKLVAEGLADITDKKKLLDCYEKFSPGARWNNSLYIDALKGRTIDNYLLVYQDTYIFGQGYIGVADIDVPEKYFKIQVGYPQKTKTPSFHIGIVTGSMAQGADDLQGAREIIRLYGDADNGGLIKHAFYPDNFMDEIDKTIAIISSLADDPQMKVIVVNQAIPGTSEAFRQVKKKRPDIVCLAGEAHEDPDEIAQTADLTVNSDFISRGYLIPYLAKQLGAKTFVHISFERHMNYESMARRMAIMKQASNDLGIKFVSLDAPDPTGRLGVKGAQDFITEMVPQWVKQYGTDTAFFCTNDAHTEPLIRQLTIHGGLFVEADIPSPILGYPGAFGISIEENSGNWATIFKQVEKEVIKAGASGRLGTWAYSLGFCQTAGMAEFGKLIAEGKTKITDTKTLLECYAKFSPGAKWNGTYFTDAVTAKPIRNFFLIYQDTYIFGTGYMGMTKIEIPEEYLFIGTNRQKPAS